NYALTPARQDLGALPRMGPYSHTASFCAIQEDRPQAFWRALDAELQSLAQSLSIPGEILWGVSTLASGGIVVRGLARSGRLIHKALLTFWSTARLAISGLE